MADTPKERFIEFILNFIPNGPPPRVHVHQYSVGSMVQLQGNLFYGHDYVTLQGEPFFDEDVRDNGAVYVSFKRHDGKEFEYALPKAVTDQSLWADGNWFLFPLDENMTAAWGPCVMSLGFDDGAGNVIWTQNFILDVERAPVQKE